MMVQAATDLNRLLQYLHGNVFGFCCRFSLVSEVEKGVDGAPGGLGAPGVPPAR